MKIYTSLIFIAVIIFLAYHLYKRITTYYVFTCPKCKKPFKASTAQLVTTFQPNINRYLKCPHCKHAFTIDKPINKSI